MVNDFLSAQTLYATATKRFGGEVLVLTSADWEILKITQQKPTQYSENLTSYTNQIYFEICDLHGKKVAGAVTIPLPVIPQIALYSTIILSKLPPDQVAAILEKAGVKL